MWYYSGMRSPRNYKTHERTVYHFTSTLIIIISRLDSSDELFFSAAVFSSTFFETLSPSRVLFPPADWPLAVLPGLVVRTVYVSLVTVEFLSVRRSDPVALRDAAAVDRLSANDAER
jgi:hypothetical protein